MVVPSRMRDATSPPSLKLWRDKAAFVGLRRGKSGRQRGAGHRDFGLAMANCGFEVLFFDIGTNLVLGEGESPTRLR
jgi:hypothetical protein